MSNSIIITIIICLTLIILCIVNKIGGNKNE